jgi:hypothetical protein
MKRIEVSGVPVLIGTSGEHDAEVHASAVCRTCDHSEVQRNSALVCTIRLVMRKDGDYTPAEVLKRSWLQDGTIDKSRVACVFDDRDKVVGMWREEGLACFQVAPGGF